ncbi:DUF5333 family protein [Phaeovulum vinaykumarii]|uniref:Lipoprotein n=1 Tax=Phaeovulum vinaykumarii TaxID=407234 RepID=A0A1N7JRK9_9RHOB|nr:DUF5333 family protein [Phaeovulum vinaykumarii]SIS51970.1 hypothetical protein SAMN05421795_101272 [Phaeovulum vinaykumarii]SOB91026.1 hypothetical protein SAMN05878426_101272 [Phaeovulum vinaykumarii]
MRSLALILAATAVLAGCVAPEPAAPPKPVSIPRGGDVRNDIYAQAMAIATAQVLAKECRELRYDGRREGLVKSALANKARAQGVTAAQLHDWKTRIDKARVQREIFAYVEKRHIVIGEPQTFCAAGRKEIALNSAIGAYLLGN